jgi:hypothetical protein
VTRRLALLLLLLWPLGSVPHAQGPRDFQPTVILISFDSGRVRPRDHPRIPPIVGVVDEGWQLLRRSTLAARRARRERGPIGVHGYDPSTALSMRGIFVASGPAFKPGATVEPFENTQIYNALAMALKVTPAANDGDAAVARSLLR